MNLAWSQRISRGHQTRHLRLLIRERLATGCRHATRPADLGSAGSGETCDGCGGRSRASDADGALDALGRGVRFHVGFALWDAERQVADREPRNSSADVR